MMASFCWLVGVLAIAIMTQETRPSMPIEFINSSEGLAWISGLLNAIGIPNARMTRSIADGAKEYLCNTTVNMRNIPHNVSTRADFKYAVIHGHDLTAEEMESMLHTIGGLEEITVMDMRDMCKAYGIPAQGTKQTMYANLYRALNGEDVSSIDVVDSVPTPTAPTLVENAFIFTYRDVSENFQENLYAGNITPDTLHEFLDISKATNRDLRNIIMALGVDSPLEGVKKKDLIDYIYKCIMRMYTSNVDYKVQQALVSEDEREYEIEMESGGGGAAVATVAPATVPKLRRSCFCRTG